MPSLLETVEVEEDATETVDSSCYVLFRGPGRSGRV